MIDLYTWGTSNGRKASIMLEECGLPYRVHPIDIGKGDQFTPEFVAINPNAKIPAIVDPNGPDGKPFTLFESGAILVYLASKVDRFLPKSVTGKYVALQWLMFQMGGIGPIFGQVHHFLRAAKEKVPYAIERYTKENRRLFPDSLWDRKDGYSAFYGTLGAAVMILPRNDILEYCARRYAATAVRRYVLLDDPALISPRQREQFKRFAVNPEEFALALRYTVALSVGTAVVVGVWRILKGWPIHWLIIPGYVLVVILTAVAPEEIVGIAYDSGGVTTSTVTVPLVTALGIGLASVIRGRNPMIDGFGLIAFASLTPIIFVLIFGMVA